jgi:hypothetical protein
VALTSLGVANNIYTQIGLILMIALSAKNGILIVEMAREHRIVHGKPILEAAVEASRLRFRPILMTSFAFGLGVVPLVLATGAGAYGRISLGLSVLSGIIASTCLAVLFVPSFFTVLQGFEEWRKARKRTPVAAPTPQSSWGLSRTFAQLTPEQPIDDCRIDPDHREYEYPGSPEQEGERLLRRRGAADCDRVGDHIRPKHHREREQRRHEEHHRHRERLAIAAPADAGEDAIHRQQADDGKHQLPRPAEEQVPGHPRSLDECGGDSDTQDRQHGAGEPRDTLPRPLAQPAL